MSSSSTWGIGVAVVITLALIWLVHRQVKEQYLQDDPMLYLLKNILQPLQPFFDKNYPKGGVDLAGLKLYKGDKSYTINKDQIFLCLYDENGEYYPVNMVIYVLCHELSHKANTYDVGHTETFHKIFDELLEEAHKLGIYNPSIPMIKDYCGGD